MFLNLSASCFKMSKSLDVNNERLRTMTLTFSHRSKYQFSKTFIVSGRQNCMPSKLNCHNKFYEMISRYTIMKIFVYPTKNIN